MEKNITSWYSDRVQKEMPVAVYGHYGFVLLLVPTAAADFMEYERFGLIDAIRPFIEGGKLKVYSVNSINNDSWLNNNVHPKHKTWMHNQFNYYIYDEVIPFIKNTSGQDTPIIIAGASFGALHSMNLFLKRPDLLNGVIAMSGVYDLTEYSKVIMTMTCTSTAHSITCLTSPIIIHWSRSAGVNIFIFSVAAVLMKTRTQAGVLLYPL
jgi:esterase/lipase superfamily enzyme